MPRPLRLEFEDAWYHVMNRGANHQDIYKNNIHRKMFLAILEESSELFNIEIHGYCLMNNHYHLLIKTPRANLARAMRHINGVYTQQFNRDAQRDGSLFRGRYKSIVITGDAYLLQVSRYIHLNPVDAKIVKQADKYQWSSYNAYLKPTTKPSWLHVNEVLSLISLKKKNNIYKKFVDSGNDDETIDFYNRKNTPVIFSSKVHKEKLLEKVTKKAKKNSSADYKRTRDLPDLANINQVCAEYFEVDIKDIYKAARGKKNLPRKVAMYACRTWGDVPLAMIAKHYQCTSNSTISNAVKHISNQAKKEKKFFDILGHLKNKCQMNT